MNTLSAAEQSLLEKLHENEYFTRQLGNLTNDIIYILDLRKNQFTFINDRVKQVMGPNNILLDKIHPFDYAPRISHIADCTKLHKGETQDIEIRMKAMDGKWRWFHIRDIAYKFDEEGTTTHTIGMVRDIHEEKLREQSLEEKEALLHGILSSPNVGIVIYRAIRNQKKDIINFEFILTSKAFEDFHGRSDLTGKWVFEEFPNLQQSSYEKWKRVITENEVITQEMQYPHPKTGKTHWFCLRYEKFGDGLMVSYEDITERKITELELNESQKSMEAMMQVLPHKLAVLRSVRDTTDRIINFEFVQANYTLPDSKTPLTGLQLTDVQPEQAGSTFSRLVNVVESSFRDDWEEAYSEGGKSGRHLVSAVRLNDGVVLTCVDITTFR